MNALFTFLRIEMMHYISVIRENLLVILDHSVGMCIKVILLLHKLYILSSLFSVPTPFVCRCLLLFEEKHHYELHLECSRYEEIMRGCQRMYRIGP